VNKSFQAVSRFYIDECHSSYFYNDILFLHVLGNKTRNLVVKQGEICNFNFMTNPGIMLIPFCYKWIVGT